VRGGLVRVGIGPSITVAATASAQITGPGGVLAIQPDQTVTWLAGWLAGLPVEALPGIGPRQAQVLREYGVHSVGLLAALPPDTVQRLLGGRAGRMAVDRARGIDPRPVVPRTLPASATVRSTFPRHILDGAEVRTALLDAVVRLALLLRRRHQAWKTGLPHWPYVQAVDEALTARGIPPGIVRADIALRPYHRTDCRDRVYALLAWDVSRIGARGGVQLKWDDETGWSYAKLGLRTDDVLLDAPIAPLHRVFASPDDVADVAHGLVNSWRTPRGEHGAEWDGASQTRTAIENLRELRSRRASTQA
jgi:hypothetical protein